MFSYILLILPKSSHGERVDVQLDLLAILIVLVRTASRSGNQRDQDFLVTLLRYNEGRDTLLYSCVGTLN